MKKTIAFFAMLCLTTPASYSQTLMHGLGATISVLSGHVGEESSSKFMLSQTNICYFPRLNFVENDNSSISVGLPLGIGIGVVSSNGGSDAGVLFAYDLPVVLDYNIGAKSTLDNEQTFGGYFGVGFGYYKVNISKSQYSDFNGASYGPIFRGGVRIAPASENWQGHGLTIGAFYKKGIEKDKLSTIGFNILCDF